MDQRWNCAILIWLHLCRVFFARSTRIAFSFLLSSLFPITSSLLQYALAQVLMRYIVNTLYTHKLLNCSFYLKCLKISLS